MDLGKTSGSNFSKPRSSSSKRSTSSHRSRSNPRPSDGNWVLDYIEDLDLQVDSKKKTLSILDAKTDIIERPVLEKFLAQDVEISTLNRKILEHKVELKSREESKKDRNFSKEFRELEDELDEIKKNKKKDEEYIKDIENALETRIAKIDDEKIDMQAMQETLKEEAEEYQLLIEEKEREIQNMQDDIGQINKIMETMTKLNSDLNSKLETKNSEIEQQYLESYNNYLKARESDILENDLRVNIQERSNLITKLEELTSKVENASRSDSVLEWAEKNLEIVEDGIKRQYEALNNVHPDHIEKAFIDVNCFFQELVNSINTIKSNISKNKPTITELLETETAAREKLAKKEEEFNKEKNISKPLKENEEKMINKFSEVIDNMEKNRMEYKNDLISLLKQTENYKDQSQKLLEKIYFLRKEKLKFFSEYNSMKSKAEYANSQFEEVNKRKKDIQNHETELKNEVKELKEKLTNLINSKKLVKNSNADEIKIRKIVVQAQLLREEMFKKDTELIRAAREKIRIGQEINSHKHNTGNLNEKIKSIEAEIIEKISDELEEKDKQIEVLKEMIRSAHSEIKMKDSKIVSLTKKEETGFRSPRRE